MTTAKRASSRLESSKVNTSQLSSRRAKIRKRVKTYSISSLPGVWDDEPDTDIRSATLDEIEEMARRGELAPTRPDAEEIELDDSFWTHAKWIPPLFPRKTSVHLRLDQNVLDWFKSQGKGHLTRMNAVLRSYVYSEMNRALREDVAAGAARKKAKAKSTTHKKAPRRAAATARLEKKVRRS